MCSPAAHTSHLLGTDNPRSAPVSPAHPLPQPPLAVQPPTLGVRPIHRPTPTPLRVPLSIPRRTTEGQLVANSTGTVSPSDGTLHTTLQIRRSTRAATPRPRHLVSPTVRVREPNHVATSENPKGRPTVLPAGVEPGKLRHFSGQQVSIREGPLGCDDRDILNFAKFHRSTTHPHRAHVAPWFGRADGGPEVNQCLVELSRTGFRNNSFGQRPQTFSPGSTCRIQSHCHQSGIQPRGVCFDDRARLTERK